MTRLILPALTLLTVTACELTDDDGSAQNTDGFGTLETIEGPCTGYQHDAVLLEPDGTMWFGCGSDEGLFTSSDGGASFSSVDAFSDWLVYDIARTSDGTFYIAGGQWEQPPILASFTDPNSPDVLLEYSGGEPFMRIGKTQNIAVTDDRHLMADSLTGNYIAYHDGSDWTEAYYWNEGALDNAEVGYQIMAIEAHDDAFYAVGSTISQPPMVFLPSTDARATYHFQDVALELAPYGTLEDLHVQSSDEVWVVGVDEASDQGILASCSGSCSDPSGWTAVDLNAVTSENGRLHAIHFDGDRGCAVGERLPQALGGLALLTSDGGATWTEVDGASTPNLLTECFVSEDTLVLAGDNTFLAVASIE